MSQVVQFLWFGIVQGSLVAAGAVGFTLLFGILNFFNVTYAEYMAFAPYIALEVMEVSPTAIVPIFVGTVAVAGIALAVDRVVFRAFRDRSPFTLLIIAIGMSFILRSIISIIWGDQSHPVPFSVPGTFNPGNVFILYEQVIIVASVFVLLFLTFLLINRTRIGIAMRASAENKDLTRVRGVDPERVIIYVTVITALIAGIAGVLVGMDANINPVIGFTMLVPVIAASIVGGVGDPRGAVVAGFGIGIIQELSVLVITPSYKPAIALIIVIVGIAFRPQGIFGTATRI